MRHNPHIYAIIAPLLFSCLLAGCGVYVPPQEKPPLMNRAINQTLEQQSYTGAPPPEPTYRLQNFSDGELIPHVD